MTEKYLRELVVSMGIGGLIAFALCMMVPGLKPGLEMFVYYVLYWAAGILGVWTVIDIAEHMKGANDVES